MTDPRRDPPRYARPAPSWRVVAGAAEPVYFHTERGALTRAAIQAERDPRGPEPVVEWRDDDGEWSPVTAPLAVTRIPEPERTSAELDAETIRRLELAARRRDELPGTYVDWSGREQDHGDV